MLLHVGQRLTVDQPVGDHRQEIVGGFAGVVLGIGVSALISRLAGWATSVGPGAVALAVFFSALVGIGFGYYPARKAAFLDPIEALRAE